MITSKVLGFFTVVKFEGPAHMGQPVFFEVVDKLGFVHASYNTIDDDNPENKANKKAKALSVLRCMPNSQQK